MTIPAPVEDPEEPPERTVRPAPRAVRNHLERLLQSHEARATPRLGDLLGYLVEETLAGRADRLSERTIAIEVFGREAAFDPATDPLVRNHADRLCAALERYHLTEGLGSAVRIALPRGSLVPQFLTVRPASAPAPALGVGTGTGTVTRRARLLRPGGPAVAVLPFRHDPAEPQLLPVAHGFAAEIGLLLTRFEPMQVIACHSSHRYGGDGAPDLRRVGVDLDARFLVLGSLSRDQARCRVEARLYDNEGARLVWAERRSCALEAGELVHLQRHVAEQVAIRVGMAGGHVVKALPRDCLGAPAERVDTLFAGMRHRHYQCDMNARTHEDTRAHLARAGAESPRHATTLAMLSGMQVDMLGHGFGTPGPQTLNEALHLAGRAVALEPESQQARWNLAYVYLHRQEADASLRESDRAALLNPGNAALLGDVGWSMALLGQWERGLALLARSHWLNPHHPAHWFSAWYLDRFRQGDYEGALQYARLMRRPGRFWDPLLQAAAFGALGRIEEAREQIARLLLLEPDFVTRGRQRVRQWVYVDGLDRRLFEALDRAGLQLQR